MTNHTPMQVERFTLVQDKDGWRVALAGEVSNYPLLLALFGNSAEALAGSRSKGPLTMAVGELMVRATRLGLLLEPKGRLDKPTLVLSRPVVEAVAEGVLQPFADLPGRYASQWSLTDWYDAHRAALQAAHDSGLPYDTGEFGAKKEIQYGRIRRDSAHGEIALSVRCEADDGIALADTAFWKAAGGNAYAGSGVAALRRAGVPVRQVDRYLVRLAQSAGVGETNDVCCHGALPASATLDDIIEALEGLVTQAEAELDTRTDKMTALAAEVLRELGHDA